MKPSKKTKEVEKLSMKERIEGHLKDLEELEKEKATFKKAEGESDITTTKISEPRLKSIDTDGSQLLNVNGTNSTTTQNGESNSNNLLNREMLFKNALEDA